MYLTYNEPPTLRVMEDVIREKEFEKLDDDMLNGIALTLMNQTGVDFFEKHGSIDLGVSYQDRRYRVNISRQRGHIMIVMRLIRRKSQRSKNSDFHLFLRNSLIEKMGLYCLAGRNRIWKIYHSCCND